MYEKFPYSIASSFQTIHSEVGLQKTQLLTSSTISHKHQGLFIGYSPDSLGEFLTQTTILTMHFVHTLLLMQYY